MSWTLPQAGNLEGKTMLITGSNTGIGFATAKLLAGAGADIVMACRNPDKGKRAQELIQAEAPDVRVSLVPLDLASLASVRAAAAALAAEDQRIDVLINNAGLMMPPLQRTADGFETQFGTNVLGHFAFTGLVLPLLRQAPRARVVWLSSIAHWDGRIDFDNLNAENGYRRWRAYAQSKLADLMLAYEMQRRLDRHGIDNLISVGAHPGGANTELGRNNPALIVMNALISPFTQKPIEGAMSCVRAAVDPAAAGGEYFGPSRMLTMTGAPVVQRSARRAYDTAIAERLWRSCEQLTDVRYLD